MNNLAEVIKFERPQVKADIEQGFDRVAGTLTDTLANPPISLSGREYQLINAVIGKTYRYHKKTDWIASIQLAEITGIDKTNVSKIKTSLIRKKVLLQDGKKIGINPIVSEWIDEPKKQKIVKNDCDKDSQKRLAKQSIPTSTQSKTTSTVVNSDPHNRKTIKQKTILQKTIESFQIPTELSFVSWCEFIQNRIDLKKPLTELAAKKFLNHIGKQIDQGFDATALIDEAISNGWQTTYPPKQNNFQSKGKAQPENFNQTNYGASTFTGDL
jgi:phage replication O-like protein O